MKLFFSLIAGDYRQRTRSYAFLVTLAVSLYIGFTFVPPPGANYVTVQIGRYVGDYNAAWIGHVTAMMTSVFLSLIGFFLVNNSVKRDRDTQVGMIIAATRVTNFQYLLSKVCSNFAVLASITGAVMVMAVAVFFLRGGHYSFDGAAFFSPFLWVTLPCLFVIACVAVLAEVFLGGRPVIQSLAFFFLFNIVMANVQLREGNQAVAYLDPFGVKHITLAMQKYVQATDEPVDISMGFNFRAHNEVKVFVFDGVRWTAPFVASRILWMVLGVAAVWGASVYFHRFDVRERVPAKAKSAPAHAGGPRLNEIHIAQLPAVTIDYSLSPLVKTEFLMLLRKGPRWFWLVNGGLMMALVFTPLSVAHAFVLPVLWFLQIGRLSEVATRETSDRVHYFTYSAYRALWRLWPSQLAAAVMLLWALAFPLLVRLAFGAQWLPLAGVLLGAGFLVLLAAFLGMLSKGKKLFEVLFFALAYANLNRVPFADYLGAQWQTASPIVIVLGMMVVFAWVSTLLRAHEARHL